MSVVPTALPLQYRIPFPGLKPGATMSGVANATYVKTKKR